MIERIRLIIKAKNLSVSAFEKSINASDGMIRRALNNKTDIQSKWFAVISDNYPDINIEWLITGKGTMLKLATEPITTHSLPISTEDKLLAVIEKKDKELMAKAKEIGRLEQEVEQLKKLEKNSSDDSYEDVRGVGSAVAG